MTDKAEVTTGIVIRQAIGDSSASHVGVGTVPASAWANSPDLMVTGTTAGFDPSTFIT